MTDPFMKAVAAVWCSAAMLTGCGPANAQHAPILSALGGKADNAMIDMVQSRNPGSLCSLVTADGAARLMSFGRQAVVDVHGKPAVLSYQPSSRSNEASFTGDGIRISGDLMRQDVNGFGKTISRDVTVDVRAGGRVDKVQAAWTCQAALPTVATRR